MGIAFTGLETWCDFDGMARSNSWDGLIIRSSSAVFESSLEKSRAVFVHRPV